MKRSPIKRKTPIRRKAVVKHTAAFFERKKERNREIYRRQKLKKELLLECPTDSQGVRLCPKCGRRPDYRGLQLVHKTALSAGGKTTRENCCIRCAPCHFGFGEPWSHRREGRPKHGLDNGDTIPLQFQETKGGSNGNESDP